MTRIDFGRHSDDYAACRPGPPASFYERLEALAPFVGRDCLDLASGPGTIGLELAARGAQLTGIDISAQQIAAARAESERRGLADKASFHVAKAEQTGLASAAFDLITAGQCWHWFDNASAMAECQRLLRPGGVLVLVHYSYLARLSEVAAASEALILERNPGWNMAADSGMYPERIDELIRGGFELMEQFCYDHDEEFSQLRWRGRMRTCNGVGSGGMNQAEVESFDRAHAELLGARFPDPLSVAHRVWCLAVRRP